MMKSTTLITLAAFAMGSVITFHACSDDDDETPEPEEFVANDSHFSGFMDWPSIQTTGNNPALAGMAHVPDSTATRDIYFKDGQNQVDGEYPTGTIIVKHSYDGEETTNEFTAMVKRGGAFNPDNNGWEWFMLMPDGSSIMDRGAALMNGACGNCHNGAGQGKDFVFSK